MKRTAMMLEWSDDWFYAPRNAQVEEIKYQVNENVEIRKRLSSLKSPFSDLTKLSNITNILTFYDELIGCENLMKKLCFETLSLHVKFGWGLYWEVSEVIYWFIDPNPGFKKVNSLEVHRIDEKGDNYTRVVWKE